MDLPCAVCWLHSPALVWDRVCECDAPLRTAFKNAPKGLAEAHCQCWPVLLYSGLKLCLFIDVDNFRRCSVYFDCLKFLAGACCVMVWRVLPWPSSSVSIQGLDSEGLRVIEMWVESWHLAKLCRWSPVRVCVFDAAEWPLTASAVLVTQLITVNSADDLYWDVGLKKASMQGDGVTGYMSRCQHAGDLF